MMAEFQVILVALVAIAIVLFLALRLRSRDGLKVEGRSAFLTGLVLVGLAIMWALVRIIPDYNSWFISDVYVVIDWFQTALLVIGLALTAAGLALSFDFWQSRGDSINERQERLSILSNLHELARQPLQLMPLLEITVKELSLHFLDSPVAVFLADRSRRRLVLANSLGLGREEVAAFEHCPFERNPVSESLHLEQIQILGDVRLVDRAGDPMALPYQSALALPLTTETDPVGVIVLFSKERRRFGRSDILALRPVAGWLADRIVAARQSRLLATSRQDAQKASDDYHDLFDRWSEAARVADASSPLEQLSRSLVGLLGCESVHLVGHSDGELQMIAGSHDWDDLSEAYRTALVDALNRDTPLILNQETTSDAGAAVTASTLVLPIKRSGGRQALVLRRSGGAFRVKQSDMTAVAPWTTYAATILRLSEAADQDLTRRKGFRRVLKLLRFDDPQVDEAGLSYLADEISSLLPAGSRVIALEKRRDGTLASIAGHGSGLSQPGQVCFYPGEGMVGRALIEGTPRLVSSAATVEQEMQAFDLENREALGRAVGDRGTPSFMAAYPVTGREQFDAAILVLGFGQDHSSLGELDRLLTLAVGLFSFRRTLASLQANLRGVQSGPDDSGIFGNLVNRVNNHLSAILGNAELARQRSDLTGPAADHIDSVIAEAERAAAFVGALPDQVSEEKKQSDNLSPEPSHLAAELERFLEPRHISGNLYMLGGKPRELALEFTATEPVDLPSKSFRKLAQAVLDQFAALAESDQMLTIAVRRGTDWVYLDISRHPKATPSVGRPAFQGPYEYPSATGEADDFLSGAPAEGYQLARDRSQDGPTYLSFRFPVSQRRPTAATTSTPAVLSIDDQSVILELITAMGQSLGYEVVTTDSASEGLALASQRPFQAILVDLAMPGVSGLDLAEQLHQKCPDTPIVLLTGWEVTVGQEQLGQAGITQVLRKPFRIEQLTEVLKTSARSAT